MRRQVRRYYAQQRRGAFLSLAPNTRPHQAHAPLPASLLGEPVRFCLIEGKCQRLVHYVRDDVHPLTLCGLPASFEERFSRRMVLSLRETNGDPKPLCKNCLRSGSRAEA